MLNINQIENLWIAGWRMVKRKKVLLKETRTIQGRIQALCIGVKNVGDFCPKISYNEILDTPLV